MRRRIITSLAILLATLLSGTAQGEFLLFSRVISVNRSVNIFDTNQFDLDLNFGDDFFAPTNGVTLFDDLLVTPANVGLTYDATSTSDPNFPEVAVRVTDGLNQFVKVMLTENQVGGLSEQRGWPENFFFGHVAPLAPPDLLGMQVDRVSLHIDSFTFVSTPSGGGPSALLAQPLTSEQQFDLVFTLSVFSAVPEPATCWLLLAGLVTMGLKSARFGAK
jgi:hypothetical protein